MGNHPPSPFDVAFRLHAMGDLAGAEVWYRKALHADAGNVEAMGWLGTLMAQRGQHEAARPLLSEALKLRGEHPEFLMNLANVLQELSLFQEAIIMYERALLIKEDAVGLSNLGACQIEAKQPEQALVVLERSIRLDSKGARAWLNRCLLYTSPSPRD